MTRLHNGHQEATPFSHWLRGLPNKLSSQYISNQNLDYVWHNYRLNYLLTIEEKRYGAIAPRAQADTHSIVAQMLHMADGNEVLTLRGRRTVRYFGHYLITFQQTTPDDGAMWINGCPSTRDDLIRLLSFGEFLTYDELIGTRAA